MKLSKNIKTGLIIGGVAVAGFVLYQIFKKDPTGGDTTGAGEKAADPNAEYIGKVKTLQKLVGVATDGIVGPITKAALSKYGLSTTVTPSNIDSLISQAMAKVGSTNKDAARYALARPIFDAFGKKKGSSLLFKSESVASKYIFDALGKLAIAEKDYNTFKSGKSYPIVKMSILGNGFLLVKTQDDPNTWQGTISPYIINLV